MGRIGMLTTAGIGAGLGVAGGFVAAKRFGGNGAGTTDGGPITRLVHIARIRSGSESELRRMVQDRFPASALGEIGMAEVAIYIGSSYMLTEYGFSGEFTPTFNALRAHPQLKMFLEEAGRLLDDEPAPLPDAPAAQYLASQALHWNEGGALEFSPRVRSKDGSSHG